jgi:hypothetical protein
MAYLVVYGPAATMTLSGIPPKYSSVSLKTAICEADVLCMGRELSQCKEITLMQSPVTL